MIAFFNHIIQPFPQDGTFLGLYGPQEEPCLIRVEDKKIERIIFANLSVLTAGFNNFDNKIVKYLSKI